MRSWAAGATIRSLDSVEGVRKVETKGMAIEAGVPPRP